MLDSKIQLIRDHFQIRKVEDWSSVLPESIISLDGIGSVTLNHLRLHLAGKGVTLRDDETPAYWQSHLFESRIGTVQVSDEDRGLVLPFTILIDVQEKHPFAFAGMTADASDGKRPILIRSRVESLGPTHGDYSVGELEPGVCHIERKSRDDALGTILGWGERRDRFMNTLEFLASCYTGAVVVECSIGQLIMAVDSRGKKTKSENQKILHRQILAWTNDYPVAWHFCDSRRLAEITTFQLLRRCYKNHVAEIKATNRKVRSVSR